MERQKVEKPKQLWVKVFASAWVKRAVPYVQRRLVGASVPPQFIVTLSVDFGAISV